MFKVVKNKLPWQISAESEFKSEMINNLTTNSVDCKFIVQINAIKIMFHLVVITQHKLRELLL